MATKQPVFDPHDQAILRALAAKSDRNQAWQDICAFLTQPRMEKSSELWLPWMEQLLQSWPDELREWPTAWLSKARAPKATALVRHFFFGGRTETQQRKSLAHLAALSQETMPKLTHFTIGVYFLDTAARRVTDADRLTVDEATLLVQRMSLPSMRHVRIEGTRLPRLLWEALGGAVWQLETLFLKGAADDSDVALLMGGANVRFRQLILGNILGRVEFGAASVRALVTQNAQTLQSFQAMEAIADEPSLNLLSEATWPALERLSLERQRCAVSPVLPKWLANAPRLRALELTIGALSWQYWREGVRVSTTPDTPAQILAMVTQHSLRPLQSLTLEVALEGRLADAMRALFAPDSQRAQVIKHLTLFGREADADVARAIAHLSLETLSVREAQASFWEAMQEADFSQLRCLAAGSSNEQTTDQERLLPFALIHAKAPALHTLRLEFTVLTHAVLDAIESAPYYPQLRSLCEYSVPRFLANDVGKDRFLAMCETLARRATAPQERAEQQ